MPIAASSKDTIQYKERKERQRPLRAISVPLNPMCWKGAGWLERASKILSRDEGGNNYWGTPFGDVSCSAKSLRLAFGHYHYHPEP